MASALFQLHRPNSTGWSLSPCVLPHSIQDASANPEGPNFKIHPESGHCCLLPPAQSKAWPGLDTSSSLLPSHANLPRLFSTPKRGGPSKTKVRLYVFSGQNLPMVSQFAQGNTQSSDMAFSVLHNLPVLSSALTSCSPFTRPSTACCHIALSRSQCRYHLLPPFPQIPALMTPHGKGPTD